MKRALATDSIATATRVVGIKEGDSSGDGNKEADGDQRQQHG
jgi:hypothetical protein